MSTDNNNIRKLPAVEKRVESGPIQFGEDWPGAFIRGDNCAWYAYALSNKKSPYFDVALRGLLDELAQCDLTGNVRQLLKAEGLYEQHDTFPNEEQIVMNLLERLATAPDRGQFVALGDAGNLGQLHHSFGQWIRNTFLLWHPKNPNTMLDYKPELVDGADHSPRHPDAVSMRVMETLYARLKAMGVPADGEGDMYAALRKLHDGAARGPREG